MRAPGAEPREAFVFVHGILGTRANWRGIARRFVKSRPEIEAITVDLPMHGDAQDFAGPYDLALCARALAETLRELALPIAGLAGHSFGGKVVLAAFEALEGSEAAPRSVWIFDSPPGTRERPDGSGAHAVLTSLREMPRIYDSREAFIDAIGQAGYSTGLGQWLAMNLHRDAEGRYRLDLKLEAIESMLLDYFRVDGWPQLERAADALPLFFVEGDRSQVYAEGERERIHALAAAGRIHHQSVPAGHWVHAEAPDAVLACLRELPA